MTPLVSTSRSKSGRDLLWVRRCHMARRAAPDTRERVLEVAATLFYAHGIRAVGMQQIIENQPVQGAHLVGPLPSELINYVMYSAGFAPSAADGAAARALVKFLGSPEAVCIIRARGMEPG